MPSKRYEKEPSAQQGLRGVRPAVQLAQALGALLGAGALLLRAMPQVSATPQGARAGVGRMPGIGTRSRPVSIAPGLVSARPAPVVGAIQPLQPLARVPFPQRKSVL